MIFGPLQGGIAPFGAEALRGDGEVEPVNVQEFARVAGVTLTWKHKN